jgi:hypothetical protein
MNSKVKSLVIVAATLTIGMTSRSDAAPLQVALFDPIQVVSSDNSVRGLRFGLIYTVNADVSGLD